MKQYEAFPILFPGVIVPANSLDNKLIDPNIRLYETKRAVINIINSGWFNKIVITDGSGINVFSVNELIEFMARGIYVEQLIFLQDSEKVVEFGKSYGECTLLQYSVENSELIKTAGGFYKLTSRYIMDNIDDVMPRMSDDNIFFNYNIWPVNLYSPYTQTIFYKTTLSFYNKNLKDCIGYCSLKKSGYLEAIYFNKLLGLKRKPLRSPFPFFSGYAGTTGKPLINSRYALRNLSSMVGCLTYAY